MKHLFFILGLLIMSSVPLSSKPLEFIPPTDPRLTQTAKEVSLTELRGEEMQNLIFAMLELSGYEADPSQTKKQTRLVGLAAPQIGVMKRIIVIDGKYEGRNSKTGHYGNEGTILEQTGFQVLINPEVIWSSQEKNSIPQGCFSVPDHYMGLVERSSAVVVKAVTPEGERIQKRYEGYSAHIVQHEIDHLNGIRFPERLNDESELHILANAKREIVRYRKNWKNWDKHVSKETWEQLKAGDYSGSCCKRHN